MLYRMTAMLLIVMMWGVPALACTDFVLKSDDGCVVNGRSMDFALNLKAAVTVFPRGKQWVSPAPGEAEGLQWKQRYGYVGLTVLGLDASCEGMNEKGLSAKILWLPSVGYQTVPANRNSDALDATLVPNWILGNFSSVAEVKEALPQILVWGRHIPEMGQIPVLHVAVHDAQGNNLVVEWINGRLHMYDNPLGVMTNEPPFPHQLANLRNYVNLSPQMQNALQLDGLSVRGTGNGSGLLGLPGDCTPPSRFVRTAILKKFAYQPTNADEAVISARHLLGQVDVMKGISRDKTPKGEMADFTQWTVIEDLTNRVLYFADYNDQTLRSVDLKKLDFTRSDYPVLPVAHPSGNAVTDVTPR